MEHKIYPFVSFLVGGRKRIIANPAIATPAPKMVRTVSKNQKIEVMLFFLFCPGLESDGKDGIPLEKEIQEITEGEEEDNN